MKKIAVKIDGMMCGMCEAHICDTIRRAFPDAKKVSASRKSGEATFLSAASYIISLLLFRRKVDRTDMIGALKDGRE